MATCRIRCRCDLELKQQVEAFCAKNGLTQSEFVRKAVDWWIGREEGKRKAVNLTLPEDVIALGHKMADEDGRSLSGYITSLIRKDANRVSAEVE